MHHRQRLIQHQPETRTRTTRWRVSNTRNPTSTDRRGVITTPAGEPSYRNQPAVCRYTSVPSQLQERLQNVPRAHGMEVVAHTYIRSTYIGGTVDLWKGKPDKKKKGLKKRRHAGKSRDVTGRPRTTKNKIRPQQQQQKNSVISYRRGGSQAHGLRVMVRQGL